MSEILNHASHILISQDLDYFNLLVSRTKVIILGLFYKVVTVEEILVTKGKNVVANVTDKVVMSSPEMKENFTVKCICSCTVALYKAW